MRKSLLGVALVLLSASAALAQVSQNADDLVPTGKGWGERQAHSQANKARPQKNSNGINYHGGPVMVNGVKMYYIWYGNWSGNNATTILTDMANNIGGSRYFNINTTYYNGSNVKVQNNVSYGGSTSNSYSNGTSLSDSAIQTVVANAINSGALPKDTNGVYFVLTSSDVTASSGFCTQYCGWHTHGTIGGVDIKYSFVGNPDRCPSACEDQTTGPNGNAGADGMASIIAHELEEATTDPDLNAWYDTRVLRRPTNAPGHSARRRRRATAVNTTSPGGIATT